VEHELDHGDLNHGFTVFGEFLIVLAQSAIVTQPSKRPFHDPAFGKDLKTYLFTQLSHDFQRPATPPMQPRHEFSRITAVSPNQRNRRKQGCRFEEYQLRSVAILDGR
jgi:hypothetical protein